MSLFNCPICGKDNPLQAIDIHSEEAEKMCMLCERENICLDCQKAKHPDLWSKEEEE